MNNQSSLAVVVNIFLETFEPNEKFSFYHNLKVLKNRDVYLVGPKRLENYIINLSESINNCRYNIVDDFYFDNSHKGNSRLMMSLEFYKFFQNYEYILICHHDAFVFEDKLDYWMSLDLDVIGAPLFYYNEKELEHLRKGLSGGLCIRRVKSFIDVLSRKKIYFSSLRALWKTEKSIAWKLFRVIRDGLIYNYNIKPLLPVIKEDIFWTEVVPLDYSWFKVSGFDHARKFAFELNPQLLFTLNNNKYPLGLHAWWKYDEDYCKQLIDHHSDNSPTNGND